MTIKELRSTYNLTQTDVALKCETSLPTIQTWERRLGKPTGERREKLIKLFTEYGENYGG